VHSITVIRDIVKQFKIGDSVEQVSDGGTVSLQLLAPTGQPSRQEPPPINNDPRNGPLTGYVTNDADDEPDTVGAVRQQLAAMDRAIGQADAKAIFDLLTNAGDPYSAEHSKLLHYVLLLWPKQENFRREFSSCFEHVPRVVTLDNILSSNF
jgi:hypothetical protein